MLPQLLELICDLYDDSQGFLDRPDDIQRWYNYKRGVCANGVILALQRLGYARHVAVAPGSDAPDPITGHETLPCPALGVRPTVPAGKWGGKRPISP